MTKSLKSRGTSVLLCGALIVGVMTGCTSQATSTKNSTSKSNPKTTEKVTRVSSENQLKKLKEKYDKNPNDKALALKYTQNLFELGDFTELQEALKLLLNGDKPLPDAIYLSAQIKYMNGNYTQAEKLYNTLVEKYPDKFKEKAEAGLSMTYYQTNQYQKAKQLSIGQENTSSLLNNMMKDFGDRQPNQIEWNRKNESVIPFLTTDPLPVVPVEINGKRMNAFIDTGAPTFILDKKFAKEFGIKPVSNADGNFARGGTSEIGFSRADSFKVGDINMKNIPVMIGELGGLVELFKNTGLDVRAVLGTNVLKQFVPTMDYPNGELVLRPRSEVVRNEIVITDEDIKEGKGEIIQQIPFTLSSTHYMFGKGSINNKNNLNFFIDSGFNGGKGAGVMLPKQTIDLLGITMPNLRPATKDEGGMTGNDFEVAQFDISSYGLGNVQQRKGIGYFVTGQERMYQVHGFFQDALISHNYLKNYKWTINFDSMTMTFNEKKNI
ncbi:aspartyl protease family protein [Clostridioides difficile]